MEKDKFLVFNTQKKEIGIAAPIDEDNWEIVLLDKNGKIDPNQVRKITTDDLRSNWEKYDHDIDYYDEQLLQNIVRYIQKKAPGWKKTEPEYRGEKLPASHMDPDTVRNVIQTLKTQMEIEVRAYMGKVGEYVEQGHNLIDRDIFVQGIQDTLDSINTKLFGLGEEDIEPTDTDKLLRPGYYKRVVRGKLVEYVLIPLFRDFASKQGARVGKDVSKIELEKTSAANIGQEEEEASYINSTPQELESLSRTKEELAQSAPYLAFQDYVMGAKEFAYNPLKYILKPGSVGANSYEQLESKLVNLAVTYLDPSVAKGTSSENLKMEYAGYLHDVAMEILDLRQSAIDAVKFVLDVKKPEDLAVVECSAKLTSIINEIESKSAELDNTIASMKGKIEITDTDTEDEAVEKSELASEPVDFTKKHIKKSNMEKNIMGNSCVHSYKCGTPVFVKGDNSLYFIIDADRENPANMLLIKESNINAHKHETPISKSLDELQPAIRVKVAANQVVDTPKGPMIVRDSYLDGTVEMINQAGETHFDSADNLKLAYYTEDAIDLVECPHCSGMVTGNTENCPVLKSASAAEDLQQKMNDIQNKSKEVQDKKEEMKKNMEEVQKQMGIVQSFLNKELNEITLENFKKYTNHFEGSFDIGAPVKKLKLAKIGHVVRRSNSCIFVKWQDGKVEQCWPQEIAVAKEL